MGGLSIIGSVLFSGLVGGLECSLERFRINSSRFAAVSGVVFVRGELDGSTIRFPPTANKKQGILRENGTFWRFLNNFPVF